eukprot:2037111-Rhodomonas_salina.2
MRQQAGTNCAWFRVDLYLERARGVVHSHYAVGCAPIVPHAPDLGPYRTSHRARVRQYRRGCVRAGRSIR